MKFSVVMLAALLVAAPPAARAQSAERPQAWVARGDSLFRAARWLESIAAYQRGLQLRAPDAGESAWRIARAFVRLGNAKQASRWVEHARQMGFADERAIAAEPGLRELIALAGRRDEGLLRRPTGCASICVRSTTLLPLRT
jgi:hypothetical protein